MADATVTFPAIYVGMVECSRLRCDSCMLNPHQYHCTAALSGFSADAPLNESEQEHVTVEASNTYCSNDQSYNSDC